MTIAAMVGCRSAPASARLLNLGRAKNVFLLIIDYTVDHSKAPKELSQLNGLTIGGASYGSQNFQFLGSDREPISEFLYYPPAGDFLEQLDSDDGFERSILLAGPEVDVPTGKRLVVWSDGRAEYVRDKDFERAVDDYHQRAGQDGVEPP